MGAAISLSFDCFDSDSTIENIYIYNFNIDFSVVATISLSLD